MDGSNIFVSVVVVLLFSFIKIYVFLLYLLHLDFRCGSLSMRGRMVSSRWDDDVLTYDIMSFRYIGCSDILILFL